MARPGPDRWACFCGATNLPTTLRCARCGEVRPDSGWTDPAASAPPVPSAVAARPDPRPASWEQWLFPLLLASCALVAALISFLMMATRTVAEPEPKPALFPVSSRSPAAPPQPVYASGIAPARSLTPLPPTPPYVRPPESAQLLPYSGERPAPVAPGHQLYSPERPDRLPPLFLPPAGRSAAPAGTPSGPPTADVIARAAASVLLVTARSPRGDRFASGFVVAPGHIVTCAHVLAGATGLTVVSGDGKRVQVSVLRADVENDLALLTTSGPLPPFLSLADSDRPTEGEDAAVLGFPFSGEGGDQSVAGSPSGVAFIRGRLGARQVRLSPAGHAVDVVRVDVGISNGYSGGPVVSARDGSVFGLISFRIAGDRVTGYAVPARYIRRLLAGGSGSTAPASGLGAEPSDAP